MRKKRVALGLALAFPCAVHVAAQTQPLDGGADTPQKSLGVVTISSGQPTSLPTQIPTTIEGVTREQIEATVNAFDSEDALKYFPSLLVRKRYIGDYNHAMLSSRASGTGNSPRSMVYADGIPLSNLLGSGVGTLSYAPRWNMVTPEEIDRVDVMYGPFSAAYPGNSMGAVVDYVTRMPRQFEASVKLAHNVQPFQMYGTKETYGATQGGFNLGSRNGDWSWFVAAERTDSNGQPLTFKTVTPSTTNAGAQTPVTGAYADRSNTNAPILVLGAGTQYHTIQDHAKFKVAYDINPDMRVSYLFGVWQNKSENRPASYLRDASGNPVYSGTYAINGKSYSALTGTDFALSNEKLQHVMHGFSLKTHTRGEWHGREAHQRREQYHFQPPARRQHRWTRHHRRRPGLGVEHPGRALDLAACLHAGPARGRLRRAAGQRTAQLPRLQHQRLALRLGRRPEQRLRRQDDHPEPLRPGHLVVCAGLEDRPGRAGRAVVGV
jgi:iron complex outermembrane receptor protein